MDTIRRSTVVGVFEDRVDADKAVSQLLKASFRQDQIGVAMRHDDEVAGTGITADENEPHTHATSGAVTGVLTGLGLGALAGLGVLAGVVPVVGPAIAAGTLVLAGVRRRRDQPGRRVWRGRGKLLPRPTGPASGLKGISVLPRSLRVGGQFRGLGVPGQDGSVHGSGV